MRFNFGSFGGFQSDPESGEYSWTPPKGEGKPRKPRKARSAASVTLWSVVITLVFGLLYFYFELPAINIHASELYIFIVLLCAVWCASALLLGGFRSNSMKEYLGAVRKKAAVPFYIICLCALVAVVGSVVGWKLFRAQGLRRAAAHRAGRLRHRRRGDKLRPDTHARRRLGQRARHPPPRRAERPRQPVRGQLRELSDKLPRPPRARHLPQLRRRLQVVEQPEQRHPRLPRHRHGDAGGRGRPHRERHTLLAQRVLLPRPGPPPALQLPDAHVLRRQL